MYHKSPVLYVISINLHAHNFPNFESTYKSGFIDFMKRCMCLYNIIRHETQFERMSRERSFQLKYCMYKSLNCTDRKCTNTTPLDMKGQKGIYGTNQQSGYSSSPIHSLNFIQNLLCNSGVLDFLQATAIDIPDSCLCYISEARLG